jgi:transcriptional regulator with XRE-family HTH domain
MHVDREYLVQRLSEGLSFEQLGKEAGLHGSTIAYWAKRHGLSSMGSARFAARGEPDRDALEELAASGVTLKEIAGALDRSISTVRYWLTKWDIQRPRRRVRADPATAPPVIEDKCRRHGLTRFGLEGRGYYRCLLCRQERVSAWRRRVKRTLVEEAGGKCQACGYNRCAAALQFHHLNPMEKVFNLSHDSVARSIARARAEAAKCLLLCANCHAEVEVGYLTLG